MNILLPKAITSAAFGAGTNIPEVDTSAGEVLWVTATNYVVGDRRVWGGYTYECVGAVTGSPANTYAPDSVNAAAYWLKDDGAPTNRMAPFDDYLFTKARKVEKVVYEITLPFIDGTAIYDIEADNLAITYKDGATDLITPIAIELWEQAYGEFEYLFGSLARGTYYALKGMPLHPTAKLTITASRNNPAVEAAIGFIGVGNWKQLLSPITKEGAAQYGVAASTRDYSYTEDRKDGTYRYIPGRKSTDIDLTCIIDATSAPLAKTLLDQILGKAVAIEVSDLPRYSHLATVGKVTGTVRTPDWTTATVDLQIKGNV